MWFGNTNTGIAGFILSSMCVIGNQIWEYDEFYENKNLEKLYGRRSVWILKRERRVINIR